METENHKKVLSPPGHKLMCLAGMREERDLNVPGLGSISLFGKDTTQPWKNLCEVVHDLDADLGLATPRQGNWQEVDSITLSFNRGIIRCLGCQT